LGLDIGTQAIKAVELRLSGQDVVLRGRPAVIPTPPNSVVGGRVVDEEAVSQALMDAFSEYHFGVKKVVASVGGDTDVVVRIAELPRMEAKELDEAVQWELDRQTPFPVDQVIYDFQAIEHPGASPQAENMEVFLAVAQEDMVNAHAEAIMAAKLVPVAIDVEPLALGRSLIELGDEALLQSTVVVVNIGHTSSLIAIYCQGVPVFTRTIPTAGDALTTAVRQRLQLAEQDAERAKRQFADVTGMLGEGEYEDELGDEDEAVSSDFMEEGTDSVFELSDSEVAGELEEEADDADAMATRLDMDAQAYELPPDQTAEPEEEEYRLPGEEEEEAVEGAEAGAEEAEPVPEEVRQAREQVSEALFDVLNELATEVRRSVQHYQRHHRQEQISALLLSGGSAVMCGLADFLGAEVGLPARVADPFANIQIDADEVSEAYLHDVGPAVSIAVGLALRDMID